MIEVSSIALDLPAQRLARAEDMLLPDEILQALAAACARPADACSTAPRPLGAAWCRTGSRLQRSSAAALRRAGCRPPRRHSAIPRPTVGIERSIAAGAQFAAHAARFVADDQGAAAPSDRHRPAASNGSALTAGTAAYSVHAVLLQRGARQCRVHARAETARGTAIRPTRAASSD